MVIVFSNYPPAFGELAKLRLRVFYIEDNQLQNKSLVRSNDEEKKKDKVNTDSDSDFDSDFVSASDSDSRWHTNLSFASESYMYSDEVRSRRGDMHIIHMHTEERRKNEEEKN